MTSVPLLDLTAQYATLSAEIDAAIRRVVDSQHFVLGPELEAFEAEVARYTGADHAVGCASGTDALILALAACEIGPGDEVLTTPFSFFATASCAFRVGARPRFVDIDPETFNLDPATLPDRPKRCRAVLPVHLFGQCAEMTAIAEYAADHDLRVIEDAAQALGARYTDPDGKSVGHAGSVGDVGCYSFFPSKNLGGFGDGGMLVTDDPELAERARRLRVHGETRRYEHGWIGWNSRLDALQAAVLRVKLPHLDGWSAARRSHADRYDRWLTDSGLVGAGQVRLPRRTQTDHIFNQYTLRVERRDELRTHLTAAGIGHAVYYPIPLHLQPCFRELGYAKGDFPRAEQAAGEVVSLPVFPELDESQQRRVVESIEAFYRS